MSQPRPVAVIVLAAGEGTRMRSRIPKVLHSLCGRSMLGHALAAAAGLGPQRLVVVVGHGRDQVGTEAVRHAPDVRVVVQDRLFVRAVMDIHDLHVFIFKTQSVMCRFHLCGVLCNARSYCQQRYQHERPRCFRRHGLLLLSFFVSLTWMEPLLHQNRQQGRNVSNHSPKTIRASKNVFAETHVVSDISNLLLLETGQWVSLGVTGSYDNLARFC